MLQQESTFALKSLVFFSAFVRTDTGEPSGYLHFCIFFSHVLATSEIKR